MKKKKGKTEATEDVKKDDEQQSQRFIEAATSYENKKTTKRFENVLNLLKQNKGETAKKR